VEDRILRLPDVERLVALDASTIRRRIAEGAFPRPVAIAPRAVGWRLSAVQAWLERLPDAGVEREIVPIARAAARAKRARGANELGLGEAAPKMLPGGR
jgi:prophage regulatory protein